MLAYQVQRSHRATSGRVLIELFKTLPLLDAILEKQERVVHTFRPEAPPGECFIRSFILSFQLYSFTDSLLASSFLHSFFPFIFIPSLILSFNFRSFTQSLLPLLSLTPVYSFVPLLSFLLFPIQFFPFSLFFFCPFLPRATKLRESNVFYTCVSFCSQEGVSVQGGLCPGGSLSRSGSLSKGIPVQGGRDLCPRGRESPFRGDRGLYPVDLCLGVSVQEEGVSVSEEQTVRME